MPFRFNSGLPQSEIDGVDALKILHVDLRRELSPTALRYSSINLSFFVGL